MVWTSLSKVKHKNKALRREANYLFAKQDIVVPICDFELQDAASAFPLVFIRHNNSLQFCAVMGLEQGKNLFVDSSGHWVGNIIPSAIRVFPFRAGQLEDGAGAVLLLQSSELIVDRSDGIPFFNDDATESDLLKEYIKLLGNIQRSESIIKKACLTIEEFGLTENFNLKVQGRGNATKNLTGLQRINPAIFDQLDNEKFLELRKVRALDIIYAHFYSMPCMGKLLNLIAIGEKREDGLRHLGTKIFDQQEPVFDFNFDE